MSSRDPLLTSLAVMWDVIDPVPEDLVERMVVALAMADLDLAYEVLALVSRSDRLVGTRGRDDVLTLTFQGETHVMVLRVSRTGQRSCRVDGWLTPPSGLTVTASQGADTVEATVDATAGRFELGELSCAPTRFVVTPAEGISGTTFTTPSVDL